MFVRSTILFYLRKSLRPLDYIDFIGHLTFKMSYVIKKLIYILTDNWVNIIFTHWWQNQFSKIKFFFFYSYIYNHKISYLNMR